MFAKSVPLRPGVTRVPRTCYGFCVRGLCRATTPLGALKRRWLRNGVIRSPLRPGALSGWIGLDGLLPLASELDGYA